MSQMSQLHFLKRIPFFRILLLQLFFEIVPSCLLVFAILSVLVFCQQLSRNSELFFSPLISWDVSCQILLSLLPPIFTFTLPISIAIGEVITLSRLGADHEWTSLEAGGISKSARVRPFIFTGIIGFIIIMALNWSLTPVAISALKEVRKNLLISDAAAIIQPQTFITDFPQLLLKVKAINQQSEKWEDVLLLRKETGSPKLQLLAAKTGRLTPTDNNLNSFEIKLSNGIIIDNLFSESSHTTSAFRENTIKITQSNSIDQSRLTDAVSNVQLESMGDLLLRLNQETLQFGSLVSEQLIEVLKRFGNSFACIFASICAAVIFDKSQGRTNNKRPFLLLVTLILLIAYYVLMTAGQNLAAKGSASIWQVLCIEYALPFLSLWVTLILISKNRLNYFYYFRKTTSSQSFLGMKPLTNSILQKHQHQKVPQINYGHYLVLSEFSKLLILSVLILTAVILLFTLLDIAPSVARNNIGLKFAIGYLFRLSPQILYYIFPFGILIAVVATATVLARTGQLSILYYYTTSPISIVSPVILGSVLIYGLILFLSETVLPYSNREQDSRYKIIKGRSFEDSTVAFDRQWVSNEEADTIYGLQIIEKDGQKSLNALIIKLTNPAYYLNDVIYANKINPFDTTTQVGFHYRIDHNGLAEFITSAFMDISQESLNQEVAAERTYREASKMSTTQLEEYISKVERTGLSTTSLRMEKMQKTAFPFACLTMLFLAFPISLLQLRRQYQSRLSTILISVGLALLFWGVLSVFELAGKRGLLPITIAAWSPHALFFALTSTIHFKLSHH